MAQNDDTDEDYVPAGADGIDDDRDSGEQDDDYPDIYEYERNGFGNVLNVEHDGGDGESESATMSALQNLIATAAGARIMRLVGQHRQTSTQVQADTEYDDDEGDDEDDSYTSYWSFMRGIPRAGDDWYEKVTEPQPAGVQLLRSGDFGKARNRLGTPRNSNIYSRLKRMALLPRAVNLAGDLKHNMIPNTHGTTVAAYESNIYVAQFSPDASFYYTCGQDFWMNIYDMNASAKRDLSSYSPDINIRQYEDGHISTMRVSKSFTVTGQWCITDSHLSSDNER